MTIKKICIVVKTALLLWVLLVQTTATQAKQLARPFLIVPSFSIGKVQLGQSQDMVHQKMGRPVKSEARHCFTITLNSEASGFDYKKIGVFTVDTWTRQSKSSGSFQVLYQNNKVTQITTSIKGYKTTNNLSNQSTFQDFANHLGEVEEANNIWFDHDLERPIGESADMESYWDFVEYGLTIRSDHYSHASEPTIVFEISVHQPNHNFLFYDLYQ